MGGGGGGGGTPTADTVTARMSWTAFRGAATAESHLNASLMMRGSRVHNDFSPQKRENRRRGIKPRYRALTSRQAKRFTPSSQSPSLLHAFLPVLKSPPTPHPTPLPYVT